MAVDFGFVLPAGPTKGQISKWKDDLDALLPRLENDFKSLWMTDHFFWNDNPTYEAWTVLAYIAARWPQFHIGPSVLGQGYRNPALIAKMAATLQTLGDGRFIMAIGAGWKEDEYRAYGYGYPSARVRVEQLEDSLEIIRRLWTEPGKVSYQGKQYQITDAYCEPKPDPIPPIIVGGGGNTTTLLAARFGDGWNLYDSDIKKYTERLGILKRHCETLERDINTLQLSWFGRLAVGNTEADALALSDGKWNKTNALVGTPRQVVETVQAFADIGVELFMVEVLAISDPDVMGMVLEEVLPKVR
jgi:alkanesulfonate monooxygenase SsuD/methylene tetrahydromethanopterin reductase-like flavin-dependent oxidoreductase (luciferase family)